MLDLRRNQSDALKELRASSKMPPGWQSYENAAWTPERPPMHHERDAWTGRSCFWDARTTSRAHWTTSASSDSSNRQRRNAVWNCERLTGNYSATENAERSDVDSNEAKPRNMRRGNNSLLLAA